MKGASSIAEIQRHVADFYGLNRADLTMSRYANAAPRQIAIYLCRRLTSHTASEVGLHFGGCDHVTVRRAWSKIESCMTDRAMAVQVEELHAKILAAEDDGREAAQAVLGALPEVREEVADIHQSVSHSLALLDPQITETRASVTADLARLDRQIAVLDKITEALEPHMPHRPVSGVADTGLRLGGQRAAGLGAAP